ncbi:hypothetical protein [Nevskia sp.]|uniref:hypothetical protein n=1 Tax=Nevskia sp. TaxID=1929292 RepID=UPI0025D5C3F6|nr:hypothetical protein [Nevskia sp.]
MRIELTAARPLALNLPAATAPLDRASLLQIATTLAAATPWTAIDALVGDRDLPASGASPAPVQPPAAAAPPLVQTFARPSATPAMSAVPALIPEALAAAVSRDRLSLSAAAAVLRSEPAESKNRPAVVFALNLLSALTGEPRSRVQLTAFGAPQALDPHALAAATSRGTNDGLQLLLRGHLLGSDAQRIALTLGMRVQRQAAGGGPEAAALDSIHAALDQLARTEIELDYPGAAASLAGHSARFQAVLDPLGLWPMQSFLLSGLLIFGHAADREDDDEIADEASEIDPDRDDQTQDQQQAREDTKAAAQAVDEPTPAAADGGLPIISAQHWLALELRHWRSQLRSWMALPAV